MRPPALARLLPPLGVVLALTGCIPGDPEPSLPDLATIERGRAIYNFRCYFCHGYSGDAKTLAATFLTPPPSNLSANSPETLPYAKILDTVRLGRPGTAMKPFQQILPEADLGAVAAFVYSEFVLDKAKNTKYHTAENGWPGHDRYRAAFPFATGQIALSADPEQLTAELKSGRALFMSSCITCHDRGTPTETGPTWDSHPLSFPRFNFDHRNPEVDATSSATPYRIHDIPPKLKTADPDVLAGEKIFQDNCAFCHAADGTGKNWIGSFLEPHPRNLRDPSFMSSMTHDRLAQVIREGLPGTSMPAWKHVLDDEQIRAVTRYVDTAFHPLAK